MNKLVSTNAGEHGLGVSKNSDDANIASYIDLLISNRWLILSITLAAAFLGSLYATIATPIYQTNLLLQVEDTVGSPTSVFGDLAGAFEMKSAATAEVEILRSRYVLGRAIQNANFDLTVEPSRIPVFGEWIARESSGIFTPGIFGIGNYIWGGEKLEIGSFSIPDDLRGRTFIVTATGNNTYRLGLSGTDLEENGRVGALLSTKFNNAKIEINVTKLHAMEGAVFKLQRYPMLDVIEQLQRSLVIAERGKQSGIIGISFEGANAERVASLLNEIGREYLRQNVERKSEEAQKSLTFLEKQLPGMKEALEDAENKYNVLRNKKGTVDLGEEAKTILQQSVLSQTKMVELKQKREELLTRFQSSNPMVKAVDNQIISLEREIELVTAKIKRMPAIEQDVVRLTRDIKVNTDLYTALLNSAQQLRLVKASKVGNARLLDSAVVPEKPARPHRALIVFIATILGLIGGLVSALLRQSLFGGTEEPYEVEESTGVTVLTAIPHSIKQEKWGAFINNQARKISILAQDEPGDVAIESLRSLRTSMQFSMLKAKNNIIAITGPTPSVGKSFVSVNFSAVLASTGKRTLLIDGDLRKGYLQKYFGVERENGLADVISGTITIEGAVHVDISPNLDFISTGTLPARPAELLESPRLVEILKNVAGRYDYVVIDTAPILAVTDALIIAPHAGTILGVVRAGVSSVGEIREALKRMRNSGNEVAGIVFNDMKSRIGKYGLASKYGKYKYTQYKY